MRRGGIGSMERSKLIAAFGAIYFIWGSTYLAIKVIVETTPPLTAAAIRFLVAGAIVYGWARLRGAPRPLREQWTSIAILGALMFLPTYAALYWAQRTVPSGVCAVLVATLPLSTVLLEAGVFRRRRVTAALAIALGIGFAGVVLLATGTSNGAHGIPWLASGAVVLGELSWALGTVIMRRMRLPQSSAVTAGGEMLVGGALLLVSGGALGEWPALRIPTSAAVLAMSYLILAGSIVTFSAYIWLLGWTSPTKLSSFTYVNPVVALAIGYQFGGEHLAPVAVIGSLLVVGSVVLVQRAGRDGNRVPRRLKAAEQPDVQELSISRARRPAVY